MPQISKPRLNPHNSLSRQGQPPVDDWKCTYCGERGTFDAVNAVACRHEYPPCPDCGQTPECALDCRGIGGVLNDPDVYVAGLVGTKHDA